MDNSIYVVKAVDGKETFEYEFTNLNHAMEIYNNEITAWLFEYRNSNYYMMKCK